ncbi:MAG: hypothetical protein RR053_00120 [Evtepia sp.]
MKRFLTLAISLALILTLAACGGDKTPPDDTTSSGVTDTMKPEVPDDTTEDPTTDTDPSTDPTTDGSTTPITPPVSGTTTTTPNQPTSQPTNPNPTNPNPTNPKPTNPKPTNPKPTNPKPTDPKPTTPTPTPPTKPDLLSLMNSLLVGTTDEIRVVTETIPNDAYKFNLFIDYVDGYQAVSSASMMGSIAHSVCLLEVPSGTDVAAVAKAINDNKDPRKWICVEAEKAEVLHRGNYILLVMSDTETADIIIKNFNNATL